MAMGKRPVARQGSPLWVTTADLPTNAGHPFFERLNRVLDEAGFDAFVEGLCAVFYAARMGRPSVRPGRYFRMLFIGYFEGLSSERGIAWRVADSLSLRSFLDLDVTEASADHSTLSRTRRLIDVETHVAVFTWVLERLSGAGLVRGKTVGVDATTLEANAAMRSIERRDTGASYEAFVQRLAEASGIETPTRAELARFDRSRKGKKTSNKEWQSPQDPDAKITKMKDGRTHLAHKAEHGVDLETGAILSVSVQDASEGDSATLPETLTMAAEQVEAVQPAGAGVAEVVADKGYHSDKTLVALDEIGVRSYVSEPERGRRRWQNKKTGETPPEKRAAQRALYGNRRRIRGARGRRLQRRRGELVERPFAHQYETGGLRRVWVRGHENVRKRVLIQAAAATSCYWRPDRRRGSLQGRALSAICGLIGCLIDCWGRLTRLGVHLRLNRSSVPEAGSANRLLPRAVTAEAGDARRGQGRAGKHDERGRFRLHSRAAARSFHGERAAGLRARREHVDDTGLDGVEAAVGAVQHLLQVSWVEPHGPERPPRQGGGHLCPLERLLYRLFPRLERLQEYVPQRLADQARQHAALNGREHPINARYVRDEGTHRREFQTVAFAVPRRGYGLGVSRQLDRGRGPRRRVAEHIERARLGHNARAAVGRQVGQAPPMPLPVGRRKGARRGATARDT